MPPDLSRLQNAQGQIQNAQSGFQNAVNIAMQSQDQQVVQAFQTLNDTFTTLMYALSDMCDTLMNADFSTPSQ